MSSDTPSKASSGWGFWSIVDTVTSTVKQKSDEIINIYKEDLQEFSRTIVTDTSAVIKEHVDQLTADRDKDANEQDARAKLALPSTHLQARFIRLQRDEKTYTEEPADSADYQEWTSTFNVGAPDRTEAITLLLTGNEVVRDFHTALVPAKVAYRDFWYRYYYKLHKIEEEEQRRAAILKNANANDDEEFSWDVEDDNATKSSPATKESSAEENTPKETKEINEVKESEDIELEEESKATSGDKTEPAPITQPEPEAAQVPTEVASQLNTNTKSEVQEPASPISDESDDIDEEIARKFESQKLEPQKSEQKSDAEDGWADWE